MSEIFRICSDRYEAVISNFGGALHGLTFEGENLIEPHSSPNLYFGAILVPWANRIDKGRFYFAGQSFQAPINEVARSNALHGLVAHKTWSVISVGHNSIILATEILPSNAYPAKLRIKVEYLVTEQGLDWRILVDNIGESSGPLSLSIHPYLIAPGAESVNDFFLSMPVSEVMLVDSRHLLPTEIVSLDAMDWQFNKKRQIKDRKIDNAFRIDKNLPRRVEVTSESGWGTFMEFDENANWIQIHTADRDGGAFARKSLAVEPMTAPPDAFNSKIDLVYLAPLEKLEMSWRIGVILP